MRKSAGALLLAASMALLPLAVAAAEFSFSVDVPTSLGGSVYHANLTGRYSSVSGYGSDPNSPAGLGPAGNLTALAALPGNPGTYLLSADAPFTAGTTTFQPCDIVQHQAGTYSLYMSGSSLGLPTGIHLDALAVDAVASALLVSFDAPVTLGSVTYLPSDLATVSGGAITGKAFDSASAGVPSGANACGAEKGTGNLLYLTFETPTTLTTAGGPVTFLPGDIVAWDSVTGFAAAPHFRDGSWPKGSAMTDFAFGAYGPPGEVPETALRLSKNGSDIDFAWSATGCSETTDYALYEGALGSWYSHTGLECSSAGATSLTASPGSGDRYYLVVARNESREGTYGHGVGGAPIPQASVPCLTHQDTTACP